jgi:hypothetical protein
MTNGGIFALLIVGIVLLISNAQASMFIGVLLIVAILLVALLRISGRKERREARK